MILVNKASINPKKPLNQFIYGSVFLLFVGMFVAAFVFSETYLQKEQARETDSAQLIVRFFDSQRRGMTDEMFTRRYDAIHLRVEGIAEQLGHADYEMTLVDENGDCVFHAVGAKADTSGECKTPSSLKAMIPSFGAEVIHSSLQFDFQAERYIYMVPLRVGPLLKGYLYVTLSDPYEFYKENTIILVMKFFSIPIMSILVGFLFWLFIAHRLILRPYLKKLVEMEKSEAVAKLAKKVAHNIQSPLVVTKSVARNMRGGDETQRRLLISAISRIDKISNHLISQFTSQGATSDSESYSFLWPTLESVVAEKIELLGTKSDIHLSYHLAEELYNAGMAIPTEEMAAVISNLLNNAIESFEGYSTETKKIVVSATGLSDDRVRLDITDTGKGIPPEILAKLRQETCTFGKANGLGVGVSDAKEVLLNVGGSISIDSDFGKGTTVRLEIPLAGFPEWFLKTLNLSMVKHVVVLDDDPSVHLLWQQRLGSFPSTHITDPEKLDFEQFPPNSTLYILDYEIVGSKVTGLDLLAMSLV